MLGLSLLDRMRLRPLSFPHDAITSAGRLGIIVAGLFGALSRSLIAAEFHVSPTGDDAATGSLHQPFRTISRASRAMIAGDVCILHAGIYREMLTPISGTASAPVTYQASPGDQVVISGCDLVTGWTYHAPSTFKAPWKSRLGAGDQLFIDGKIVFRSRWPDNPGRSLTSPPLATAGPDSDRTTLRCADLPAGDLRGAQVWIMSGTRWEAWTSTIESSGPGYVRFTDRGTDPLACRPGASFYLFGSDALLSENEWEAGGGYLFLRLPPGSTPDKLPIESKVRPYGIDLSHRRHVRLKDLRLFGCTVKTDRLTEDILMEALDARYVSHWETPGGSAPPKDQRVAMALEGRNISIQNSTLYGAAGSLVTLEGSRNRLVNCLISEAGYAGLNSECVGIFGTEQLVSHNTIHSGGRSVVGFGATRSKVAFNDVSRAGLLTWDVGLLTTGNRDAEGSEICHNWFHDNLSGGLARGIFLSTGTHNLLIHHNVVWNCWEGGFHGEPPMEYVQLINNTFYTTPGAYDAGGIDISSFTFVDNLVGCFVLKNILTDDIRTLGHDVTIQDNLLAGTNPEFVDPAVADFRLERTSPALAMGRPIAGISPEKGVGAYAGTTWRPGHDFGSSPRPALTFTEQPFGNQLRNSGFESPLIDAWKIVGESVGVTREALSSDPTLNTNGSVHSGRHALRLSRAGSGISQTTGPLLPHRTYVLTGWAKLNNADAVVTLRVAGQGGMRNLRFKSDGGSARWRRGSLAFTTGTVAENLTVSWRLDAGEALIDDTGMALSLVEKPLLTTARADMEVDRGNGLNQFELSGHWRNAEAWTKDDRAHVRFHGKQVVLYARISERSGIMGVSLDGGPETLVDCYYPQLPHHATVQPVAPVYRSPLLTSGPHTLKIRVTGDKHPASKGNVIRPFSVNVLDDTQGEASTDSK